MLPELGQVDVDVEAERQRVDIVDTQSDTVVIRNLSKVYNSKTRGNRVAVNQLCLGIPPGQVHVCGGGG